MVRKIITDIFYLLAIASLDHLGCLERNIWPKGISDENLEMLLTSEIVEDTEYCSTIL